MDVVMPDFANTAMAGALSRHRPDAHADVGKATCGLVAGGQVRHREEPEAENPDPYDTSESGGMLISRIQVGKVVRMIMPRRSLRDCIALLRMLVLIGALTSPPAVGHGTCRKAPAEVRKARQV